MMKTLTYTKDVLASKLRGELVAGGVQETWAEEKGDAERRLGVAVIDPVTITADFEHIPDGPAQVEILCADTTDEKLVATIVDAHDPTPVLPTPPPPTEADRVLAVIANADPDKTDLRTLLLDLQQAIAT